MYPQKTGKTQERCTIVFELPPLQEYTVTLYTPRTRSSVFLNIQMTANVTLKGHFTQQNISFTEILRAQ